MTCRTKFAPKLKQPGNTPGLQTTSFGYQLSEILPDATTSRASASRYLPIQLRALAAELALRGLKER
jgi:hypothetical protein